MQNKMRLETEQLVMLIAETQDGNPCRMLEEEVNDGRLIGVTDNLNRLLADVINNAVEANDLETMYSDLGYASGQLELARAMVEKLIRKQAHE